MNSKLRFHAIAISIICLVVVVLFALVGPEPAPTTPVDTQGDRAIEIYSATWGEACNPFIERAREAQLNAPPEKNEKGEIIPHPPIESVTQNNVLQPVSQACNGKITCQVRASSTEFGVEPLSTCFKRLELNYRCFSIDRLHSLDIGQGETAVIDCHDTAPAAQQ